MLAAVAVFAAAWAALLVLAPLLRVEAAGLLYLLGSRICHQIPERSFYVDGAQLPVCARCLGIYAGAAAGGLASLWRAPAVDRRWLLAGGAIVLATVAIESASLWPFSNPTRAFSGAALGLAAALVTGSAISTSAAGPFDKLHYEACAPRRRRTNAPHETHI